MLVALSDFLEKKSNYIVILIFLIAFGPYFLLGPDCYIQVHDNLDERFPLYKWLKDSQPFWSYSGSIPVLGALPRFLLPASLYYTSLVYHFAPNFAGYIFNFCTCTLFAYFSALLFFKTFLPTDNVKFKALNKYAALLYALTPAYPFSLCATASLPLLPVLLKYFVHDKKNWVALAIFCYPLFSDFSRFGIFILLVGGLYYVWLSCTSKTIIYRGFMACLILGCAYLLQEWRMVYALFFEHIDTIRAHWPKDSFAEIFNQWWQLLFHGQYHFFAFEPAYLVYIVILPFIWLLRQNSTFRQYLVWFCSLVMLQLLLSLALAGSHIIQIRIYIFFGPILLVLFLLCLRKLLVILPMVVPCGLILLQLAIIQSAEIYSLCLSENYSALYRHVVLKDNLNKHESFRTFFSQELFDRIKKDLNYEDEKVAAVLFHPSILTYNGFSTLDGYFNIYPEQYKQKFRKIIEPELAQNPIRKNYFDSRGHRALLFTDKAHDQYFGTMRPDIPALQLRIDPEAFKEQGGKYIFSMAEIKNSSDLRLKYLGLWTGEDSPYKIRVYETE